LAPPCRLENDFQSAKSKGPNQVKRMPNHADWVTRNHGAHQDTASKDPDIAKHLMLRQICLKIKQGRSSPLISSLHFLPTLQDRFLLASLIPIFSRSARHPQSFSTCSLLENQCWPMPPSCSRSLLRRPHTQFRSRCSGSRVPLNAATFNALRPRNPAATEILRL
jgi:hypothetical protein